MCCGDNVKDDHGPLKEENAFRRDDHDGTVKTEDTHHEEVRKDEHHVVKEEHRVVKEEHHGSGPK